MSQDSAQIFRYILLKKMYILQYRTKQQPRLSIRVLYDVVSHNADMVIWSALGATLCVYRFHNTYHNTNMMSIGLVVHQIGIARISVSSYLTPNLSNEYSGSCKKYFVYLKYAIYSQNINSNLVCMNWVTHSFRLVRLSNFLLQQSSPEILPVRSYQYIYLKECN